MNGQVEGVITRGVQLTIGVIERQGEIDNRPATAHSLRKRHNLADARVVVAGYVVSLPDILFDVDKVTLKPEA